VFNGYTQAINQQENTHGALFESSVKYCQIDTSPYLLQLIRYIHLNPVSAKLVSEPASWPYSNYLEWIGKRNGTLMDRGLAREMFGTSEEYEQFVKEGMQGEPANGLLEYTLEKSERKN
jgi:putative transposase